MCGVADQPDHALHLRRCPTTINLRLLTLEIVGTFVVFGLALFLAAGTVVWLSGWVFLVLFLGFAIATTRWLLRHNPGLLTERMTGIGKPNQPVWDRVFFVAMELGFLAWLALMPLDAVRFRWSQTPGWLQVVGAVILLCSFYLFFLTFRENPYLSPAVRVQTERGQTVISTGPYRYVRHPMYAGVIPFVVGTTLLLGSWYGLLTGLILVVGVAFRAVKEGRLLRAELPGYDAYMARVKYRLIPYVW
jgi:protein-S-isoprenylcysteine O-methyltransferase Ste14